MGGPTAARRWMVGSSVTCRSISRAHTPRPIGSARAPRNAHPSMQGRVPVTPIAATTNRGQTLRALVAFSKLRSQGGADPRKPCIHLTVQGAHNLGRRVTQLKQRLNLPPQGLHLGVRLLRRPAALFPTPARAAP